MVVPLFACASDEEAKKWLDETGSRLHCLRDVDVACVNMYEFIRPEAIGDDGIRQIYRDEEQQNITQGRTMQAEERAALETEKRLARDTIKTIDVYDNAVRVGEKLPSGLSREEYEKAKKSREEMAAKHEAYKKEREALADKRAELDDLDEAATARTGKTGQTARKAMEASGARQKLLRKDWARRGVVEAEARARREELDEEEAALDRKYGLGSQTMEPTDLPIPEGGFSGFEDLSAFSRAAATEKSKQEGLLGSAAETKDE